MANGTRTIEDICDAYVSASAALDPVAASSNGITGHDHALTDFSPDGADARAELDRRTLSAVQATDVQAPRDARAARVLVEDLREQLEEHAAADYQRDVSTLYGPVQRIRMAFDNMPTESGEDWEAMAARMEQVPWSLATARTALAAGLAAGHLGSARLASVTAEQARTWAGDGSTTGYFSTLVASAPGDVQRGATGRRLAAAAAQASAALGEHARYLTESYAPRASDTAAVGADRYARHARSWTGAQLDLGETYAWGWHELAALRERMRQVARRIVSGAGIDEAVAHAANDPVYVAHGAQELRSWLQALMDQTIAELNGTHFDIPAQITTVEAMIAPPDGAAAMYYTPPSEDFRRPGRTWYPTQGRTRFPLMLEKAICYHEGVPGHHLEVGGAVTRHRELTRYQRTMGRSSGYSEGWALYAERLMGELGYLDDPVFELGQLSTSAMRAARVVVDIGMHLSLTVPPNAGLAEDWLPVGATMTPALALELMTAMSPFPREFMASEVDRYLGLPGQAISYKVGERVWLEAREDARRRRGADFDLREFHTHALSIGSMGLDQLRDELGAW